MASVRVRVYPASIAPHLSQIYTGLIELHHARKIRLEIVERLRRPLPEVHEHLLWTQIHAGDESTSRTVCFDMRDGGQTIAEDAVGASDLYFKRSYDPGYIEKLSDEVQDKIRPYGLNYACRSGHMRKTLEIQRAHRRITRGLKKNGSHISMANIARHMTSLLLSSRFRLRAGSLQLPEDFESYPNQAAEDKILFLSRAWNPATRPPEYTEQFIALNDTRANTIRALKRNFGERFIGGLQNTLFARRHYPDCIAEVKTDKNHYLRLVRRCMITVTTTGLYGSIGWKLPEYLAASRCIVTEPLLYGLPTPLTEGVNMLTFTTPEQCLSACEHLLVNPSLAARMRVDNFTYYKAEVKPDTLLWNRIQDALRVNQARLPGNRPAVAPRNSGKSP